MRNSATGLSQRLHIYYHCGIRSQKTILSKVLRAKLHNDSISGASGYVFSLSGFGEAGRRGRGEPRRLSVWRSLRWSLRFRV